MQKQFNIDSMMEDIRRIKIYSKLKYYVILETDVKAILNLDVDIMVGWCKDNCIGDWMDATYIFIFEYEKDAAAFKLKFS